MMIQVIRELLADLPTVTVAGQHYSMHKVLDLLRQVAVDSDRRSLEELAREEARLMPDVAAFVPRVEALIQRL